jgi:transposase
MGKSKGLSSDVKTIIIRNYEAGKSYSEIGRNFQLNRSTAYAVVQIYHEQVTSKIDREVAERKSWTTGILASSSY